MTLKIAIIFCNYGPYHLARLEGFFQHCLQKKWQVIGIELARNEAEYPWETQTEKFPCPIISVIRDRTLETAGINLLGRKLISVLNQARPDVVAIAGYAHPGMLLALLWCMWYRKGTILFSETAENDGSRSWWKEKLKSLIVRRYHAALVGGQPHKRYTIKLGMPADAVFCGYDVVGNDIFHTDYIQALPRPLTKPFLLAINRFVPKKNLPSLISAYATYRQLAGKNAWDLVLCGDGKLRPEIEQQINSFKLQNCVHLPGFLQQEQLLPYFAHAGCFVHASFQEEWGLVVNEAMAAGLPVIVSKCCGCFEDLVIEGVNGFGFDPKNASELVQLLLKITSDEIDRKAMSQASLQHIQKFSPAYFAQGLSQAVDYALTHR
ncbi:glycosyltransferase [Calothrix sp. UHCC 0171]|uniref:glycosyltransferase family 4 protein n=1 Tax=Calothrix sp. UHCC 0171 TaxID=3110245 RepID=UPI002B1F15CB|nr:glycosyltransferase [Calothrix sp. UHCC 0171]MEA5570395.1 glycosyltransferase [Calothrix sp. UHCC 0171]